MFYVFMNPSPELIIAASRRFSRHVNGDFLRYVDLRSPLLASVIHFSDSPVRVDWITWGSNCNVTISDGEVTYVTLLAREFQGLLSIDSNVREVYNHAREQPTDCDRIRVLSDAVRDKGYDRIADAILKLTGE